MKNNLTTTNQNAKLALIKSKSLLNITNGLLANRSSKELIESFENFRFSLNLGYSNSVSCITITHDGKYIVRASLHGTIKLCEISSGMELRTFKGHGSQIFSIATTPNGKYLASGGWGSTIKLWDISSGKELRTFDGHSDSVNSLAIAPNGKYIASGNGVPLTNGIIKLWDINSGEELLTFNAHKSGVSSIAITTDGNYILSSDDYFNREEDDVDYHDYADQYHDVADGIIRMWDINNGKLARSFFGHSRSVSSMAITPDGKYIVSGSWDKTIKLWNINSGEDVRTFEGHSRSVSSIAITPDGKYIISGSADKTIKLWNINSGKDVRTFEGHKSGVSSIAITPDGKYIVSGSYDGTIKLWEINSGKLLCSYAAYEDGEWLSWTPDGYYNCSDGAYKYFSFVDDSKEMPESVPKEHPVYKAKKKEILLGDYIGGTNPYAKNPPPQTDIGEYDAITQLDIDDDEIPF